MFARCLAYLAACVLQYLHSAKHFWPHDRPLRGPRSNRCAQPASSLIVVSAATLVCFSAECCPFAIMTLLRRRATHHWRRDKSVRRTADRRSVAARQHALTTWFRSGETVTSRQSKVVKQHLTRVKRQQKTKYEASSGVVYLVGQSIARTI